MTRDCPRCQTVLDPDGRCRNPAHLVVTVAAGSAEISEELQWAADEDHWASIMASNGSRDAVSRAGTGNGLAAVAARYTPVNWAEAWLAQPDAVEWLFEPFLERGTVNALFAKPGTGKSLVALEVALRIVRNGQTVVYVDEENRVVDLVERLQAFGAEPGELDRLLLYSFAGLPPLDTYDGGHHLLGLAATADADLVVLDTTTRMISGGENDADTFLQLYRNSLVPLKGRGVTVLRLDHPGKDEQRGQRGSSAKDGDVDTVWHLKEVLKGLQYRLIRTKSRNAHGDADELDLRRRFEPLRHEWTCPETLPVDKIIGQLSGLGVPPDAGRGRCRAALKTAGIAVANDLLEAAIRKRKAAPGSFGAAGQPRDEAVRCPPAPPIGAGSGQSPASGPDDEDGEREPWWQR